MPFYVYIMTNEAKTLYIGVTNDLARRVHEHKTGTVPGFTSRYKLNRLAWYDTFDRVVDAIAHEKRLKRWNRAWKIDLIETSQSGMGGLDSAVVRGRRVHSPSTSRRTAVLGSSPRMTEGVGGKAERRLLRRLRLRRRLRPEPPLHIRLHHRPEIVGDVRGRGASRPSCRR